MNIIYKIINKINCLLLKMKNRGVFHFKYLVVTKVKLVNKGENNIIEFGNHCQIKNCVFKFYGSNNVVKIGARTEMSGITFWIGDDGNNITIGNDAWFLGGELAALEGTSIKIGDNCMFSHGLLVRTSDSHSILDFNGKRLNNAENIYIGNNVWIGTEVLILKGASIGDHCVVGARSVVTSSTPHMNNCIVCGIPCKIVKENTTWDIERL